MLCRFQRFEGSFTAKKLLCGRYCGVHVAYLCSQDGFLCAHVISGKRSKACNACISLTCHAAFRPCLIDTLTQQQKQTDCLLSKIRLTKGWQKHEKHLPQMPVPSEVQQASASNKLNGHQQSCCKQLRHASCISHLPTTPVFLGASNSTPKAFKNSEVLLGGSANT